MIQWKLIDENGNEIPREQIDKNPLEVWAKLQETLNDPETMALLNAFFALPDSRRDLFDYLIAGYRYYKDTDLKGKTLAEVIAAAFNEDGSIAESPYKGIIQNAQKLYDKDHEPQIRISTQTNANRLVFDGKTYADTKRDIYYQTGKKPDELARIQINWGKAAEQIEHKLTATQQYYIIAAASILRTKPYTTPDEIIKLTKGRSGDKISKQDRDAIRDALDTARQTQITIQDYLALSAPTAADRANNVLKIMLFATIERPEINSRGRVVTRIYKNGDDYLDEMISEYQYKRYTTYTPELLNYPGRKDEPGNALFLFFASEIGRIKNRNRNNIIKIDTIYKHMDANDTRRQKRIKDRLPEMLQHFKANGIISGYKLTDDRIEIYYKPRTKRGKGKYKKALPR